MAQARGRLRPAGPGLDRPRQHVRRGRVLPGVPQARRQADHRHGGVRRRATGTTATPTRSATAATTSFCWPATPPATATWCNCRPPGFLEGFYYKPRIDRELLSPAQRGADRADRLPERRAQLAPAPGQRRGGGARRRPATATSWGRTTISSRSRTTGCEEEAQVRQPDARSGPRRPACGLIATNDCHFLEKSPPRGPRHPAGHPDRQDPRTIPAAGAATRPRSTSSRPNEMVALFQDWPQAVENTLRVAEMVDFKLELGKLLLPKFPHPRRLRRPRRFPRAPGARGPAPSLPGSHPRAARSGSNTSCGSSSRPATPATS